MNSVCDVPDRDLLNRNTGPKRLPHFPADLSVQLADAIGAGSQTQRKHRHAEPLVGTCACKVQEIPPRQAQLSRGLAKVPVYEIGVKVVLTSFNGSVSGENQAGGS